MLHGRPYISSISTSLINLRKNERGTVTQVAVHGPMYMSCSFVRTIISLTKGGQIHKKEPHVYPLVSAIIAFHLHTIRHPFLSLLCSLHLHCSSVMAIGETVLGAVLAVVFDKLASQEIINFFRRSKIDQFLVEELKRLMLAAEALLLDAEEKQRIKPPVKEWLDELQHWFFRAEEVMDEIATEALRSSLTSSHGTPSRRTKVRKFVPSLWSSFSFNRRITQSISEIVSALERMLARKDALGLKELSGGGAALRDSRATTSVLEDLQVYGRDQDRKELLKFLLSKEAGGNGFSIVAIVGMGGIGKTTLAKTVFNDATVLETFEVKAWVSVSDPFDIHRVTKSTLDSITTDHGLRSESADLNVLQNKLKSELMNKKFLLVLDDVWNEDYHRWQTLRAPFLAGTSDSKIIVTTRNKKVANIMRANPVFSLEPLSDNDGWSLFSRHAFKDGNLMCDPCFEDIGRKIVQKCGCLPLAIKALGGLLGTRCNIEYWQEILHSSLWDLPHDNNNVMPALWLSYYYLPGHLKRCFSYCAVFPKDYEINRERLVLFWMAEKFLSDKGKRMEEKGFGYIDDLVSGSFLEPVDEFHVMMHDLMHDLAQGVLSNLLATPELETPSKFARHFSYTGDDYDGITKFQAIKGNKYLRSFLKLGTTRSYLTNEVPSIVKPSFPCLRVLSLSGYTNLSLPELVECPRQLRYLDVSSTGIKQLPKWVSTLCNLQTLILSYCSNLERLPADMWRLVSLRHLDIRGASLVSHMPTRMGELKNLRTLTDFVVGRDIGSCIKELSELQEIRGKFAIRQLQNVASPRDAYAVDLRNRKFIDDLELEFDYEVVHEECREVLENLKPHSDVKRLSIRGYGGATLPKWLGLGCAEYKEIKFLCLSNCRCCSSLPPLGQLRSLKELTIKGMDGIQQVGHEFYGHDISSSFPSLESLTFENMKGWEVWSNIGADGGAICFPRLKELCLTKCPNLRGNLPVHVPSLVNLEITGCTLLRRVLPRVPSAHVPVLQQASCQCPHTELPKALVVTSITKLSLAGLEGVEYLLTELVMLLSLSDFSISQCDNLRSLADVQLPPSLKSLDIGDCKALESLPDVLPPLHNLRLSFCQRLICIPGSSLPTSLRSLSVYDCNRWEFPISIERMKHYTCLETLILGHTSEHLVCFPLGVFPNLCTLWLANCEGLEKVYIPEGIEDDSLASLCYLSIWSCDALEMIGKETGRGEATTELPAPNLAALSINECGKVKPVVVEREGEILLPKLQKLSIDNSASGESPHSLTRSLFKFSCLTYLRIEGLEVESFPVAGEGLPTSLTALKIWEFGKLRKLDGEALLRLKYLRELDIRGCPELERLPEEGLPPSLGELLIEECPKLEKKCKPHKGKYWSKIHHIPRVEFDYFKRTTYLY